MTDTTQTPAPANIFQQIEATLSADAQKVVAFVQHAEQFAADFLGNVAAGLPILVADVEGLLGVVAGKISTIKAGLSAASSLAAKVAPNNTAVQKLISAVGEGAQDLADAHVELTTGVNNNDPTIVTQGVTVINAANDLADLLASTHSLLGNIAGNSPTATQAVSPPTPTAG